LRYNADHVGRGRPAAGVVTMRLDIFLPFLRRKTPKWEPKPPRIPLKLAQSVLPSGVFADFDKAKPGLLRRVLKAVGPTWLSAPVRRVIQGICLITFTVFFVHTSWPYSAEPSPDAVIKLDDGTLFPSHYADDRAAKEKVHLELFLILDPLVSLSTALAAKAWVWSLVWAGIILGVCILFPRGFCGYLCPLGTLIDIFDWALGKRITRFRVERDGWWINLKYYILTGVLAASLCGVLLSGFVAAIPVITRGFLYVLSPFEIGFLRGWHQVPPMNAGQVFSIVLFLGVLGLGFLRPRFWCKYVCPSGAVFSVGNLVRAGERKVEETCIHCNRCVEVCPFDAIKPDFTTRTADCTLCQTCGGVCPTHAIKFVGRWEVVNLKPENDRPVNEIVPSRRGFLFGAAAGAAAALSIRPGPALAAVARITGSPAPASDAPIPIRPPGSVPEDDFLQLCIRCGECFQVCPNNVLQPMSISQGLVNLWTPEAKPDWSGCEPSCNNCGQVCPTGAIRALPLFEKRVARMGLAIVNEKTCLPLAGKEACQLCVDECTGAGYNAIEFERVGTQVDDEGFPVEGSGFLAPRVIADKCVGCGLCQMRCVGINVIEKQLLTETAIRVVAGPGNEDRLMSGSYVELRLAEKAKKKAESQKVDFQIEPSPPPPPDGAVPLPEDAVPLPDGAVPLPKK